MANNVKPVPDSSSKVIPRLFCRDVVAEIEFCKAAFSAVELGRRPGPDGRIAHGLLTISGEMIMLESEYPGLPSRVPTADGSSPVVIFVYVANVDQAVERAVATGGKVLIPLQNQFWGDRTAWIMDPAGHVTTADERNQRWEKIRTS
jgi:PhnB protein